MRVIDTVAKCTCSVTVFKLRLSLCLLFYVIYIPAFTNKALDFSKILIQS